MATADEPDIRVPFERDTAAPASIRRVLAGWLDPADPAAYDVILAASELVTNAVIHTASGGEFRLWRSDERLRIEVSDFDSRPPRVADPGQRVGGFGLRIVAATSLGWGSEETDDGKVVWAEFFVNPAVKRTSKRTSNGSLDDVSSTRRQIRY